MITPSFPRRRGPQGTRNGQSSITRGSVEIIPLDSRLRGSDES